MSKPLIPFSWLPGSWGLQGTTRKVAQIEYEYANLEYERDCELAKLKHSGLNLELELLHIGHKHKRLSEKEYDYSVADLTKSDEDLLKAKLKHGAISQKEYDKQMATHHNKPWVDIPDITFDTKNPGGGALHLDWNEPFITMLEENGYVGRTSEDAVDLWLTDLCRNIALEELNGTGTFNGDSDEAMRIKRKRLSDGTTEVK